MGRDNFLTVVRPIFHAIPRVEGGVDAARLRCADLDGLAGVVVDQSVGRG
jgi:hypothetical protein